LKKQLRIIGDDREKSDRWDEGYLGHPVSWKRLKTGDYTIAGLEKMIAIEKKSGWQEIASNIQSNAENLRFHRMLSRLAEFPLRYFVVQADLSTILEPRQYDEMHSAAVLNCILEIQLNYGIPVLCVGPKERSKVTVQKLFEKLWKEHKLGSLYYYD